MPIDTKNNKYYLLSSQARVQAPYIKVTIGSYTFGAFTKETKQATDENNFYIAYDVKYPNFVQNMTIVKINGKVNQYTLVLKYPITQFDDPNFFEKVLSSVSSTRKIKFSYGDSFTPNFIYKDEEAIITKVQQSFDLNSSVIQYTISATSSAALGQSGSYNFTHTEPIKPSDEIKRVFNNPVYGLQSLFTGMNADNIDSLIDGSDKKVTVADKLNISALDYIGYLVECMIPLSASNNNISSDLYILTIHDDVSYDKLYNNWDIINDKEITGPYFKVTRTTQAKTQTDAFVLDIGYNTSTLVLNYQIENNENYSLFYDYQTSLNDKKYVRRLNNEGKYEDIYAPVITSNNEYFKTTPEDITWYTKITRYPINATITIQGLLRPAVLMQYVRLNVIFPGGHKHISSGLYIVTKQIDSISEQGYTSQLSLTKIEGDEEFNLGE